MTDYKYRVENFSDIMEDLFERHAHNYFNEVEESPTALNPDFDKYRLMSSHGNIAAYTCRDEQENLLGFLVVIADNMLHDKDTVAAQNDLFYVAPEVRGQGVATELLRFAAKNLKSLGAGLLSITIKDNFPVDDLLLKENFYLSERTYVLNLGD